MTNKLVVIINSLKVPKIKKILLYEIKFLVPNYSCLQNPWIGAYRPPDPCSLCPLSSTEFVEPPPNKIPGYATALSHSLPPLHVPFPFMSGTFSRLSTTTSFYKKFNTFPYTIFKENKNQLRILQQNGCNRNNLPLLSTKWSFFANNKVRYFTTIDFQNTAHCYIRATLHIETHYVLDLTSTPGFKWLTTIS